MQVPNALWRWLVANGYRTCRDCGVWFKPKSARNTRCPTCGRWYARHASAIGHGAATCPVCGRYTREPSGIHPACMRVTLGRLTPHDARRNHHAKAEPNPLPEL